MQGQLDIICNTAGAYRPIKYDDISTGIKKYLYFPSLRGDSEDTAKTSQEIVSNSNSFNASFIIIIRHAYYIQALQK